MDRRAMQGRRDRLTGAALSVMLQRGDTSVAKYGKPVLGLTGLKKLVGRDRLTNLLNG